MFVSTMAPYAGRQSWITGNRQNLQAGSSAGQSGTGTSGSTTSAADPVSAFTDLIKGSPEQRMFKMFLARHKLTEAQYDALSTDDKKKLQDEFEKETEEQAGGGSGTEVDVVV